MRRIELADAGFLYLEKRGTPMHVGGVNLFTLPEGVREQAFLAGLTESLQSVEEFRKPFGEYVTTGPAGPLGPMYWEKDNELDLDYHVRHSALPDPGRYRELFALVSRLHGTLLDRSRPLWEVHLIEGMQNRQFAVYMKMHHAAIDGVGAMHLTQSMYSSNKRERIDYSPFSQEGYERYKAAKYGNRPKPIVPKERELRAVANALQQQFNTTTNLFGALRRFAGAYAGLSGKLSVPWHKVPHTSINTQVTSARRFVAQSWDFDRIKAVCEACNGTVNDIVLAMCSGALMRYLDSQNERPTESLKAMVPVSVRVEGDIESSNAVGFITADLSTRTKNPERRLIAIQQSMRAGKELFTGLSAREISLMMQLTQVPALLVSALGLAGNFPAFSTVISNVPGPSKQLYWNGARLDGIYPASAIMDGFALNITLVSYNNRLDFGVIACRRSIPQVQRMIGFLEESLQELEEVAGLRTVKAKRRPQAKRKTPAKPRAETKARPKTKTQAKSKTKAKAKAKTKTKAKAI